MYHVLIKGIESKDLEIVFKDLNKKQLKQEVIRPYLYDKPLVSHGRIIRPTNISEIKIYETIESLTNVLKKAGEQSIEEQRRRFDPVLKEGEKLPFGFLPTVGWDDEEIINYGEDRTTNFINTYPGSKSRYSFLLVVINNPWIVVIGGTVLSAVIIGLLNL